MTFFSKSSWYSPPKLLTTSVSSVFWLQTYGAPRPATAAADARLMKSRRFEWLPEVSFVAMTASF
jgi:hypothetical protein